MTVPKEDDEAIMLANWLKINKYTFSHIANESWLPRKVAMLAAIKKKRMWLTPWFPDYCIILKRGSLLFIELKRQRPVGKRWKLLKSPSVISDKQLEWIDKLNNIDNVAACIAYGHEDAKKQIEYYENL